MAASWLIVNTPANFAISASLGWTVQGFKARHGKKAAAMRPGDRLIYYLTREQVFAGLAEVTSPSFEAHDLIWHSEGGTGEDYPWRARIAPLAMLQPSQYLPAEPLAQRLAHVRKWPAANWTLAFQGNVHLLPAEDGELLAGLLAQAARDPGTL
jgi:hypothetical protein